MTTYREGLLAAAKVCDEEEQLALFEEAKYLPRGNPALLRIAEGASRCAIAIRRIPSADADQRGAAHGSRVGSTPGDATRLDSSLGVAGAVQSAPHQNAGPETVSVPRDAFEGFIRMMEKQLGKPDRGDVTPARMIELARAMLAAGSAK